MSIKSDKWIRRMAAKGMIEPFAPEQVRNVDGRKIVSYGTSSYGYDVRCANEFKIFTNINSTIVDPKAFDPQSFVDVTADVCIIPPNSFALARTVEFFRIPRSVLTVCLGKCLTGDTRVVDAETGDYLPITEMRFGRKTIAMDGWELRPAAVSAFMRQGVKPVFELRTRAGLKIKATANHPFRQFYGWTALEKLKPGDRIAVARQIPVFGRTPLPRWEAHLLGLMISEGQCRTPGHSPTFTSSDPVLVEALRCAVAEGGLGTVTHNGDLGYRIVNHTGRGGVPERNRATAWLEKHGLAVGAADKFVPGCVFRAPRADARAFLQALFAGDGGFYRAGESFYLEYYSKSRRLVEDVHHLLLRFGIFGLIREKTTAIGTRACSVQITDVQQIVRFAHAVGFLAGSQKQRRLEECLPLLEAQGRRRSNFDSLPNEAWLQLQVSAANAATSLRSMGVASPGRQSVAMSAAARVIEATRDPEIADLPSGPIWDTVTEIIPAGEEETYDITVPWLHNFVANGMVVHNSTYARCFSGDTRVALVDGSAPTLEEMAGRADAGEQFRGFSLDASGNVMVTTLEAPRFIGRDALLEIELDDGSRIHATPDHRFIDRHGRPVTAGALRPGDSLMPLYRRAGSAPAVYQPMTSVYEPVRPLLAAWAARRGPSLADSVRSSDAVVARRQFAPATVLPAGALNHSVASVRSVPGDHDVFCLTVPEAGNFALEAGVFVHNCGIIVNVTPLEPEWEGHVTLEFSNTTPLPAKIYANEGVAQMLFFESDEICDTSYADRGGKYQGQRGVTLPKT
jgi:deoxycytidine triphosphate deaminase/intein/homing endonuclease